MLKKTVYIEVNGDMSWLISKTAKIIQQHIGTSPNLHVYVNYSFYIYILHNTPYSVSIGRDC